jgi:Fe-S cluster biogenesis protein NfuA
MAKITTRLRNNLTTCSFTVDSALHANGTVFFKDQEQAKGTELAEKIFALAGVSALKIKKDSLEVTRDSFEDWPKFTRLVAPLIEQQLASGKPAVAPGAAANMPSDAEIREKCEEILEAQINPAVASHGGSISIIDVKDAVAYVKLSGGCQGCASSAATLKQGVERSFREAVPELDDVLDTTDHAAGANPYYAAPGAGGGHAHGAEEDHGGHSHGGGGGGCCSS